MSLHIRVQAVGKKLNRLLVFSEGTYIGEYERSQKADIPRKKIEIANAESLLLSVFRKHGEFVVRWDGSARKKSVRVQGSEVTVIPKSAWEAPSWQ